MASGRVARCAGYLAGLHSYVDPRTGLTALGAAAEYGFEEALELVHVAGAVEKGMLLDFEAELEATRGWTFVHGCRDATVLDGRDGVRALVLNERPHLVQSSVRLDANGAPAASPPPLLGDFGTAAGGLALAGAFWRALGRPAAPRVACLGGGGCAAPAVLARCLGAAVVAVEPVDAVRDVARALFLPPSSGVSLVGGCGAAHLAAADAVDVLLVDAEHAGAAPPPPLRADAFYGDVARVAPAVVAVNVLGDAGSTSAALAAALPGHRRYAMAAPGARSPQTLVFAVAGAPVSAAALRTALDAGPDPLLDEPDLWLAGLAEL